MSLSAAPHQAVRPSRTQARHSRRRRVPHRVPCRVRVLDDPDPNAFFLGQTVNVSARGLAVQLQEAIPEGTAVEAIVPHNEGDSLCVRGRVRHLRRVLTGVFEMGIVTGAGP